MDDMRSLVRRDLLATCAVGAALIALSSVGAQAQWSAIFAKIPWDRVLGGIASALSIVNMWADWTKSSDKNSGICKLSTTDLLLLEALCRELALSIRALDYQPIVTDGNQGAIPALTAYANEPDENHRKRAQAELRRMLLAADAFLRMVVQRLAGPDMQWSVNLTLPAEDLRKVTEALQIIEYNLEYFIRSDDGSDLHGAEGALSLVKQLESLPVMARRAIGSIRLLEEARAKTACL
jgi:hypothetical protein